MLRYHVFGIPLIIAVLLVFPALLILMGTATWVESRFANKGGRQHRLAVKNSGETDQRRSTIADRRSNIDPEPVIEGSTAAVIEAHIEHPAAISNESPALVQTFAALEDAGEWRNQLLPRPIDLDEVAAMRPGEDPIESGPIQAPESARQNQPVRMGEPRPPPAIADPDFSADVDQELADIAKRLKAAIRGLVRKDAAGAAEPAQPAMTASEPSTGSRIVEAPMATSVARAKLKSIYDALEIEMSSGQDVP
jgi:hypothetical protein